MEVPIVTVHQNLPQRLALCEEKESGREGGSGMTSEDRLYNKQIPPPSPPQLERRRSFFHQRLRPRCSDERETVSLDGDRPRGSGRETLGPKHHDLAQPSASPRQPESYLTSLPNDKVKEMTPSHPALLLRDCVRVVVNRGWPSADNKAEVA